MSTTEAMAQVEEMEIPPRPTSTAELVLITPALAAEWLASSPPPRKARPGRVQQYSRDIRAGHWLDSGETIVWDRGVPERNIKPRLRNGQHRLMGIVAAKRPAWSWVIRGVDPRASEVIDSGAPRSLNDVLRERQEVNVSALAAGMRFSWLIVNGAFPWGVSPTRQELLAYLDANPGLRDSARAASGFAGKPISWPPGTCTAVHYLTHKEWPEEAAAFFAALKEGSDRRAGSPVGALRRWLENRATEPTTAPMFAGSAILSFNSFITGQRQAQTGWRGNQKFPAIVRRTDIAWPEGQDAGAMASTG